MLPIWWMGHPFSFGPLYVYATLHIINSLHLTYIVTYAINIHKCPFFHFFFINTVKWCSTVLWFRAMLHMRMNSMLNIYMGLVGHWVGIYQIKHFYFVRSKSRTQSFFSLGFFISFHTFSIICLHQLWVFSLFFHHVSKSIVAFSELLLVLIYVKQARPMGLLKCTYLLVSFLYLSVARISDRWRHWSKIRKDWIMKAGRDRKRDDADSLPRIVCYLSLSRTITK